MTVPINSSSNNNNNNNVMDPTYDDEYSSSNNKNTLLREEGPIVNNNNYESIKSTDEYFNKSDDWNDKQQQQQQQQQDAYPLENITMSLTLPQMEENVPPTVEGDDDNIENNKNVVLPVVASNDSSSIHTTTIQPTSKLLRFGLRFPRFTGILFGIVVPLWVLVIVAAFFGYFLARIEGPSEIEQNNAIVADQMRTENLTNLLLDLNVVTPRICYDIYKIRYLDTGKLYRNTDTYWADDINTTVLQMIFDNNINKSSINSNRDSVITLNESSFLPFMYQCGIRATQITDQVMEQATIAISAGSSNLTFNWIICTPEMNGLGSKWDHIPNNTVRRPQAQTEFYTNIWQTNQQELYAQYVSQITTNDTKEILARKLYAYRQSLLNATGGTGCDYNAAASGWFWFTVMTSIGYGNYVPETPMGRLMIYTVGFMTILVFAIVLNVSGYVISAIVEDFLVRFRFRIFMKPWAAAILWGSAYYLWMFCIGNATRRWFRDRLGTDMSGGDAYWFSYISTTTIGFGDIYLPASVFTGADLLVFPVLFLVGFVFLAAFLQHLATFLNNIFRGGRDKPYLEKIISQLAKVDILDENRTPVPIQNAIDVVLPPTSSDGDTDNVDHTTNKKGCLTCLNCCNCTSTGFGNQLTQS